MDQTYEIEGQNILKDIFPVLPASDVLKLEGIANRDSLPYAETYALGELDSLRTVLRGTIRCVEKLDKPSFHAASSRFLDTLVLHH